MQPLYLQEFDLPGAWDLTEETITRWLTTRLDLDLAHAGQSQATESGSAGRRYDLRGNAGTVTRWNIQQQRPDQPDWTYHVDIWLLASALPAYDGAADCKLRCRLSVQGTANRLLEFQQPAGAPAFVGTLLREGIIHADGWRLGRSRLVSTAEVPELGELVLSNNRRLPVVVVTPEPRTGRPVIDADQLAHRLGGLAHVVTLSARSTTFAFTDLLGSRELSVFGGAVRLYWPVGRRDELADGKHPLWFADRLTRLGADFAGQLFARLGRISALSLAEPRLEAILLREQAEERRDVQARRQLAVEAQLQALRDKPVRSEIDTEWLEEHERVLQELDSVSLERDQALDLVRRLEEERDRLESTLSTQEENFRAIALAASTPDYGKATSNSPEGNEPADVEEAVEMAAAVCQHLVFLPEAFDSARRSGFDRPQQVFRDLLALDKAAQEWRDGSLPPQGVEASLVTSGVSGYRNGVSSTAHNKYPGDYRRTYKDERVLLGPHLRHGTGAPRNIMRIYWYEDRHDRVLVVGHVGEKLRDDSNP